MLIPVALEQRWTELQQAAEAIGCEIRISLFVGGIVVNPDEVWRVHENSADQPTTLAGQLRRGEELVQNDLVKRLAETTGRLRLAEELAKSAKNIVENRYEEYKVARDAFHMADDDQHEGRVDMLGMALEMAKDDDLALGFHLAQTVSAGEQRRANDEERKQPEAEAES
jgi:hypothetical protein